MESSDRSGEAHAHLLESAHAVSSRLTPLANSGEIEFEELHELHRQVRRVVVGFRPWRRALPPESRVAGREVSRRLQTFGQLCGQIRDRDIGADLLAKRPTGRSARGSAAGLAHARARLLREARAGRRRLTELAQVLEAEGTVNSLLDLVGQVARTEAPTALTQQIDQEYDRRRVELSKALDRAIARVTPSRYHDLRKELREMRLFGETFGLAQPIVEDSDLSRLQRDLGRLHDLDVLIDCIRPEEDAPDVAAWALDTREKRRRRRNRVRRQLHDRVLSTPRRPW
jgi:CHAD domain-containing protein